MIQRLIYDPEVAQGDRRARPGNGRAENNVAFQTAERYAREIVPGFSAFTYFGFAIRAARFLSQSLYRVRLGAAERGRAGRIDPRMRRWSS
jgi:glycerol-3-phosphate O-acyltransferase